MRTFSQYVVTIFFFHHITQLVFSNIGVFGGFCYCKQQFVFDINLFFHRNLTFSTFTFMILILRYTLLSLIPDFCDTSKTLKPLESKLNIRSSSSVKFAFKIIFSSSGFVKSENFISHSPLCPALTRDKVFKRHLCIFPFLVADKFLLQFFQRNVFENCVADFFFFLHCAVVFFRVVFPNIVEIAFTALKTCFMTTTRQELLVPLIADLRLPMLLICFHAI
nr:MAG TPA: hypothetical protein [Caudoviricetes sp.]